MNTAVTTPAAALTVLLGIAGFALAQSEPQEAKIIRVRRLTYPEKLKESEDYKELGEKAMGNPVTLKTARTVRKLLGKEAGDAMNSGVDFQKDMMVAVFWETGGPPCGWLTFEVKDDGLNFYMQGPSLIDKRGVLMSRKKARFSGVDFFLVTKEVAIRFEPGERPYPEK